MFTNSVSNSAPVMVRNVAKTYGQVSAVSNVSLHVHRGEIVTILGPNGAGKSTLMNMMTGLLQPDSGEVAVLNQNPALPKNRAAIGVMQQQSGVPEALQVRELIHLFSSYYPNPLPLSDIVTRAGLEGLEKKQFSKLSGGQQQRVFLGIAICGNPEVLFLDEPTTGLDPELKNGFWLIVRSLAKQNTAVILTTHQLDEAELFSDRIIILNKGKIIQEGTPQEIKAMMSGTKIRCKTKILPQSMTHLSAIQKIGARKEFLEIVAAPPEPVVHWLLTHDKKLTHLTVEAATLEESFLSIINQEQI